MEKLCNNVSQKTMDFFGKISHEILKISHVFWKTWEVFFQRCEDDFTRWRGRFHKMEKKSLTHGEENSPHFAKLEEQMYLISMFFSS